MMKGKGFGKGLPKFKSPFKSPSFLKRSNSSGPRAAFGSPIFSQRTWGRGDSLRSLGRFDTLPGDELPKEHGEEKGAELRVASEPEPAPTPLKEEQKAQEPQEVPGHALAAPAEDAKEDEAREPEPAEGPAPAPVVIVEEVIEYYIEVEVEVPALEPVDGEQEALVVAPGAYTELASWARSLAVDFARKLSERLSEAASQSRKFLSASLPVGASAPPAPAPPAAPPAPVTASPSSSSAAAASSRENVLTELLKKRAGAQPASTASARPAAAAAVAPSAPARPSAHAALMASINKQPRKEKEQEKAAPAPAGAGDGLAPEVKRMVMVLSRSLDPEQLFTAISQKHGKEQAELYWREHGSGPMPGAAPAPSAKPSAPARAAAAAAAAPRGGVLASLKAPVSSTGPSKPRPVVSVDAVTERKGVWASAGQGGSLLSSDKLAELQTAARERRAAAAPAVGPSAGAGGLFAAAAAAAKGGRAGQQSQGAGQSVSLLRRGHASLLQFASLQKLGSSPSDVLGVVMAMEPRLTDQALSTAKGLLPTAEERATLQGYDGPVESLVPLERFLKAAASVPRVEAKLECGIIMRSFKSQADEATQSTKTLTQASREVVGCKGLVMLCSSLLEAVVAVNKGTALEGMAGFKLDPSSISKLKSPLGPSRVNILDFVVKNLLTQGGDVQKQLVDLQREVPTLTQAVRLASVAAETAADPVRDLERKYQQVEKERDSLKQDLATSAALSAVDSNARSRLPDLLKAMDRFLREAAGILSQLKEAVKTYEAAKADLAAFAAEDPKTFKAARVKSVFAAVQELCDGVATSKKNLELATVEKGCNDFLRRSLMQRRCTVALADDEDEDEEHDDTVDYGPMSAFLEGPADADPTPNPRATKAKTKAMGKADAQQEGRGASLWGVVRGLVWR